jgi:hypothetical protein
MLCAYPAVMSMLCSGDLPSSAREGWKDTGTRRRIHADVSRGTICLEESARQGPLAAKRPGEISPDVINGLLPDGRRSDVSPSLRVEAGYTMGTT